MVSLFEQLNSSSGILLVTDQKAKVLYANRAVEDTLGFSVAEAVGRRPSALWGGTMKKNFYTEMWESIDGEGRAFTAPITNHHKTGRAVRQRTHIAPVFDQSGETAYYLAVQTPKTEASTQQAKRFTEAMLDRQGDGQHIVQLLSQMLSGSVSVTATGAQSGTLLEALEQELIEPMAQQFAYREDDRALITAAQVNSEAFSELYAKYRDDIYYYFFHHVGEQEAVAEDLTQEVFLRAFRHLPAFELRNASYRTYLRRVAHNLLVNHFRKQPSVALEAAAGLFSGSNTEQATTMLYAELMDYVQCLTPVEQQVIMMKYRDGYSVREISNTVQKTENAVKLHLSRGRKKLRGYLR